jgi:hypothetical protein
MMVKGILAGHLDGRFIGLSPTIAEKSLGKAGCFGKKLGQLNHGFVPKEVGDVPQFFGLLGQNLYGKFRGMTEGTGGDTSNKVQILFAFSVPNLGSLTFDQG